MTTTDHATGSNSNDDESQEVPHKRQRLDGVSVIHGNDGASPVYQHQQSEETALTMFGGTTTSKMEDIILMPTMRLLGHKKSVYSLAFDPSGECLCSSSLDMTCLLWNTTTPFHNYNVLTGHKNAVLDVKFSGEEHIVTASADKTLMWWDACTGDRIRTFRGHTKVVNAVDATAERQQLLASASDDGFVKLWDARVGSSRGAFVMQLIHGNQYQVTSVAFSFDAHTVYSGGIDNLITAFDIRAPDRDAAKKTHHHDGQDRKLMSMKGHTDTITCLSIRPDGTQLLSNSMDGTIRSWDIRPFVSGRRLLKTFVGGTHNAEKGLLNCCWSADGTMISGGSADRLVHVWDEYTAEELYCLPGHTGCVNSVLFHPHQNNFIASASSDKAIFIGQLAQ